MSKSAGRKS